MMQVLRVLPNPWAATDRDGDPCAVVPRDPDDGGGGGQFVGARIDKSRTKVLQDFGRSKVFGDHARHEIRSPIQSTKYSYLGVESGDPELAAKLATKDPIELPDSKYYRARLREGAMVPADEQTAKRAGVPFTPPAQLFAFKSRKPFDGALPQSPDANGNVLEAPATPDGQPRESLTLPADGESRTAEAPPAAPTTRKRNPKPDSEA